MDNRTGLRPIFQEYRNMLAYIAEKPLLVMLSLLCQFFANHVATLPDLVVYDKRDYWATLKQTLGNAAGDCDDIAVAIFTTLKNLGYSPLIVVGKINGMSHAWVEFKGYVLDQKPNWQVQHRADRKDLVQIYKLDENNLYIGNKVFPATTNKQWADVNERMKNGVPTI